MEKKSNVGIYVLISVLLILVLGLSGYIVFDKMQDNNNENKIENAVVKDNEKQYEEDKVAKLDKSKDWVYDASYDKNVSVESYKTSFDTYYAKDIVVPYINVDSSDAELVNKQFKSIFSNAVDTFNAGVKDKMSYVDECSYKKSINDNILSVIVTYGVGATDVVIPEYYTANIDLKNGNKVTFKELYTKFNLTESEVLSKVESEIKKILNEYKYGNDSSLNNYINESIKLYKESIKNDKVKYYVEDGKFFIVADVKVPTSADIIHKCIQIK